MTPRATNVHTSGRDVRHDPWRGPSLIEGRALFSRLSMLCHHIGGFSEPLAFEEFPRCRQSSPANANNMHRSWAQTQGNQFSKVPWLPPNLDQHPVRRSRRLCIPRQRSAPFSLYRRRIIYETMAEVQINQYPAQIEDNRRPHGNSSAKICFIRAAAASDSAGFVSEIPNNKPDCGASR